MQFRYRWIVAAAAVLAASVSPEAALEAQTNLCTSCPVQGVIAKATTPLGPSKSGGPCSAGRASNGYPLPDAKCTPGAFNPTVTAAVFGNKNFRTGCVRDCLTNSTQKHQEYKNYGITEDASCELDHLIPLEMGGADSLNNIWPQCGKAPNGKNYKDIKDQVENYLAIKVIQGMDIDAARKGIASDWTQYIGPAEQFCAANSCDIGKYRK